MPKSFKLKQAAWFKDIEQEFVVPDSFEIDMIKPNDAPPMAIEEMNRSIRQPFGASLKQMASNKKRVVFVVDDLGRPTPAHQIIPTLMKELYTAGVQKGNISFVIATGSHRQLSKEDMERKLGKDIVVDYPVHCHDAFNSPMVHLGTLDNGFPCIANQLVAKAELIVGIGCVIPHACHGFGGGAKLFCPGIAGMESIVTMHGFTPKRGRGQYQNPRNELDMRSCSEEFIKKLAPIFLVNVVVNSNRDICALFAGEAMPVYHAAVEKAFQVYQTLINPKKALGYDVVLINAYPLDSDPVQSAKSPWVKEYFPNSLHVFINSSADGIDYHGWKVFRRSSYPTLIFMSIAEGMTFPVFPHFMRHLSESKILRILRQFIIRYFIRNSRADFKSYMNRQEPLPVKPSSRFQDSFPQKSQKPWVFSENMSRADFQKKYSHGALLRSWKTVVDAIAHYYPHAKIAVVTCAPMQIPVERESHESAH